jgi:hypothetical protein
MGYTLTIGEAKLREHDPLDCDGELIARYVVEHVSHPDAPAFGEPTDRTNSRWPSYSVWRDFARDVGLEDFFYCKERGLIRSHPGCFLLQGHHLEEIRAARLRRQGSNGGRPPGFWDEDEKTHQYIDNGNDPELARLIWLEYWVNWALSDCKVPAIANS